MLRTAASGQGLSAQQVRLRLPLTIGEVSVHPLELHVHIGTLRSQVVAAGMLAQQTPPRIGSSLACGRAQQLPTNLVVFVPKSTLPSLLGTGLGLILEWLARRDWS